MLARIVSNPLFYVFLGIMISSSSRTATARGKAEQADIAAVNAREDSEVARVIARELAPDFIQPGKIP